MPRNGDHRLYQAEAITDGSHSAPGPASAEDRVHQGATATPRRSGLVIGTAASIQTPDVGPLEPSRGTNQGNAITWI